MKTHGMLRSMVCMTMVVLLAIGGLTGVSFAKAETTLTVLYTTDIHSNDAAHLALVDGVGGRYGGFARLKTAVDQAYRAGETLLLDSGDFSMGTLYQNYSQSDALELTLMDAVGYDAVALGNHDFELGEDGLREELTTFRANGGRLAVLASNLTKGDGKANVSADDNPLSEQGVSNYTVLERNGVRIGVFSLMGKDAISYTPVTSLSFADPIQSATAMVRQLREVERVDLVIALSHAGILPDGSFHEDRDIAEAVDGIDVILSGHEHAPLTQMVTANGTAIVCAGTALDYLGKLVLTKDANGWNAQNELIALDDTVAEDTQIAAMVESYTQRIQTEYLEPLGVTGDATADFAVSAYDFPDGDHMCLSLQNYAFGALITDAYFDGLTKAGQSDVAVAVVPVGFVRNGLYKCRLQMMDVYNALGYGISPIDGSSGAPICTFYLNGRELYDVCETSVSLSAMMNTVQMLLGGLRFEYSNARLPLDRVYRVETRNPSTGEYEAVQRDEAALYKVAVSWTAMQNLSLLGEKSFGLLSVTPKDANGVPYASDALQQTVALRSNDVELKEWYALYDLLCDMPTNEEGLHMIDARYGDAPIYMTETEGSVGLFFRNPSKAFWAMTGILAGVLIVLTLLVLPAIRVARRIRRHKGKPYKA